GFAPYITEDPHGASGFAGLVCYTDDAYPAAYRDCLFLGNPITGRIHRDHPTFSGATHPLVRQPDLLISSDPWFRPVDIELGPDGALYVADWYNRVIAHVEVPLDHPDRDKSRGRIWRIVYRGDDAGGAAKQFDGPVARDWSTLGHNDLLAALAEPNAWVRRMAAAQLRARFADDAIAACRRMVLGKAASPVQRMEAVWLLQTLGALPQPHAEALLNDPDPWIRREAVRIVAAAPETQTRAALLASRLSDSSPHAVHEAAMALRGTPSESSLRAILNRVGSVPAEDTLLRYALRFAARDHLLDDEVIAAVEKTLNAQQLGLDLQELLAATPSPNAARILEGQLSRNKLHDSVQPLAIESIFANGAKELLQTFLATSDESGMGPAQKQYAAAALFKNRDRIAKLGIDPLPHLNAWTTDLTSSSDTSARNTAIEIAAELDLEQAAPLAREIVRDRTAPPIARERATRLLMRRDAAASAVTVRGIIADPAESVAVRRAVAREYAKYVNDAAALTTLAAALKTAPLDVYGGAVESLATRKPGVFLLLDAVENQTIGAAYINNHVTRIRIEAAHKDPQLTARYDRLVARAFKAENEGLITARAATLRDTFLREPNRDPHNGRRVFEENCVKCHRLAGNGAFIGPNLDGLANRGIERVLQDIATPSLDVDPAFLTTLVSLEDGENLSGLVVRENETQLVLADTQGQERSIPKNEIVERTKFPLSPMPT
ncbi:MAG: c-type cytochrome, partial [Candidatus Hydrogenedentes bacterium]|nr:c-type cytochrome [Candidatus Hydrogenedentota bacterium]